MRISDWSSDVCSSDLGRLGIALLLMIGAISLATLTLEAQYHQRWLSFPGVLATAQVPLATLIITFLFYRSLRLKKDGQPFFWALALFGLRSEEHTSELQSLMRISYAVFCLKKKKK